MSNTRIAFIGAGNMAEAMIREMAWYDAYLGKGGADFLFGGAGDDIIYSHGDTFGGDGNDLVESFGAGAQLQRVALEKADRYSPGLDLDQCQIRTS